MKRLFFYIISIILFTGCVKIGEYYAGMHLQPELPEEDAAQGLNVYGVIKTGPSFDTLNYFFEVHQLLYIFDSYDSICIDKANIFLSRKSLEGVITEYSLECYSDCNYYNENIKTAPGDRWQFVCQYDTFKVSSSCTIPEEPKVSGMIARDETNEVEFTVNSDTSAYMYYAYLLSEENYFIEKRIPLKEVDTKFVMKPEWKIKDKNIVLFLFAYDENLEKYQTTSNIFFKPNAYRPCFTTVNGGYGTFGAVSSTFLIIK